jgi:hypothetical protein
MNTIKIDRNKWLRGKKDPKGNEASTYLWDIDCNAGCCLGHAIHQISKVPYNKLNELMTPEDYFQRSSLLTDFIRSSYKGAFGEVQNNNFARQAIRINDNYDMTDKERERKLVELFLQNGIILQFYN